MTWKVGFGNKYFQKEFLEKINIFLLDIHSPVCRHDDFPAIPDIMVIPDAIAMLPGHLVYKITHPISWSSKAGWVPLPIMIPGIPSLLYRIFSP